MRYIEYNFFDSVINNKQLDELIKSIRFNGGTVSENNPDGNYMIKLNVPIGLEIGRVRLKRGIAPIYLSRYLDDENPIVKLRYRPKPFKKSEIYRNVIEWVQEIAFTQSKVNNSELVKV